MALPLVDLALLVAYVLLLAGVAVQYRRGKLSRHRLLALLGTCLTWLAYALVQVSQDGLAQTGTPLNYALDASAVVALLAGLSLLYRWWRERDDATATTTTES